MNKITKIFFGLAATVALYSCEGGTTFTKNINNISSETLTVTVHATFGDLEPVTIAPNEEKNIYWDDQMGRFTTDAYRCTNELDSITVSVSNGKILTLDLMDDNNWIKESKDGRNSREDCTVTISDNDLE